MKLLTKRSPAQYAFYGLGIATTAGSILGTYRGIESELGASLAIVGSVALGVTTYAALNVVFNHRDIAKRVGAAALSVSCVIVSGETILLDATNKARNDNAATLSRFEKQVEAKSNQALLSDRQIKNDLRLQLKKLSATNAQDRDNAETQQNDLRSQIDEIRRLNSIDETRIAGFQKNVDRKYKPQGNRANIRNARKEIDARLRKIDQLNQKITVLANALQQRAQHRDTQSAAINERLTTQPAAVITTATATLAATAKVSLGTRVRSYLYDLMTVIFLLLVSWYRTEEKTASNELETTEVLPDEPDLFNTPSDTLPSLSPDAPLKSQRITPNPSIHRLKNDQLEEEKENKPEPLTESDVLDALGKFRIPANDYGRITPAQIEKFAHWGPSKARKFMSKTCVSEGVLDEQKDGRGKFFVYPSVITRQLSLVQGGIS